MPEIIDLKSRVTAIGAFGEFSTADFTLIGLGGEPRTVKAGVVGGSFFDVMGLRPVLGRLLNAQDDGPAAAGAAVLTHKFWSTSLRSDPNVVGRPIRLGPRTATVVGVLEPSIPYPAETEIFANVVTSPHHLGAAMVTSRTHRMTELFGRLAPGATLDAARAELTAAHTALMREHPEAYAPAAGVRLSVSRLRDQIASPARTILLMLLAAAAVVFVIACSNVANLILARSVRREGELAVRAALGAGHGALRRTLLAESLVLCGAGALLGVAMARPLAAMVVRYAARFSVRALEVTVDASVLWVGAGLAIAAAVLLAFVPRLPSPHAPAGLGLASGSMRITPGTNRRLRVFATTQIACSFVLLAGASTLLTTLLSLQTARTGYDMRNVLVFDIPSSATGVGGTKTIDFYQDAIDHIGRLPGVEGVAIGSFVPVARRRQHAPPPDHHQRPHARCGRGQPARPAPPCDAPFFRRARHSSALRPRLHGRRSPRQRTGVDRQPERGRTVVPERRRGEPSTLVDGPGLRNARFRAASSALSPTRMTKIENIGNAAGEPALTVYVAVGQIGYGGRLFVRAAGDPYALVPAVTRAIREISADQPVERAATLEDVRADVLSPERLNAFVFSGFAGIALLIAVVGVAGVLAFSVSARTREFGVRLAVGASPRDLLARVLSEGAAIAGVGILAGALGGLALGQVAKASVESARAARRAARAGCGSGTRRRGAGGIADSGRARRARGRRAGPSIGVST